VTVYLIGAATAWLAGFLPFFGLYVAIPAAVALGLDYASATLWAALGNFTPVLLIVLAFERLRRLPRLGPWLQARTSERFRALADRYGMWLVLVVTPFVGVWALAVTSLGLGMDRYRLAVFSGLSIALYALAIAAGLALGLEALEAVAEQGAKAPTLSRSPYAAPH
jgi:uncharacterized membrane protein